MHNIDREIDKIFSKLEEKTLKNYNRVCNIGIVVSLSIMLLSVMMIILI